MIPILISAADKYIYSDFQEIILYYKTDLLTLRVLLNKKEMLLSLFRYNSLWFKKIKYIYISKRNNIIYIYLFNIFQFQILCL